jgi:hypothetical protein
LGGGATGSGVAVDAATRGFSVLLVEREDFGKGTSSRSTKLVHGGVRYLEQGNVSLVMEALKERGLLLHNAPYLVHDLLLVVPTYSWWESPFYGIGLKVYDVLAGEYGFGKSRLLSREETLEQLPTIRQDGLKGGVAYHDGQFDDTRLLTHLMATAVDHGATVLNYTAAVELLKDPGGFVNGVTVEDRESGERFNVTAKVVVNATGIFADEVRRFARQMSRALGVVDSQVNKFFGKGQLICNFGQGVAYKVSWKFGSDNKQFPNVGEYLGSMSVGIKVPFAHYGGKTPDSIKMLEISMLHDSPVHIEYEDAAGMRYWSTVKRNAAGSHVVETGETEKP